MQKEYQAFVNDLRTELLKKEEFREGKFRLSTLEGDSAELERLYLECGQKGAVSQVCSMEIGQLYHRYENIGDIGIIADGIVEELNKMDFSALGDIAADLTDYEKIRNRLFVRLLNHDRNKDSLGEAVYRVTGDIAQVLYVRAGVKDGVLTSAKIQKDLLKVWKKDEDEVFDNALLNTYFLTPPRVYKWEKMLCDSSYEGDNFMDLMRTGVLSKGPAGNCISTEGKTNGAVAVFLPGVLARISDLLESDLYLAFTSIHEVMVHAAGIVEPEHLEEVLNSTVDECTPEEELLSRNIYFYGRKEGQLICVRN